MKKILSIVLVLAMLLVVAATAEGTKITVLASNYVDSKLELFQDMVGRFTAETGIEVEVIAPGNDSESQLKTMMAANELPDVWMTHGWSLMRYSEYLKPVNDQPWFNDIDLASVAGAMTGADGNVYALCQSMGISGLVYNEDVLAAAGVDPMSIKTWADFDAACEKIKAIGVSPLAIGGAVGGNLAGLLGSVAPTWWTDAGAKHDMGAALKDGSFDFDTYATELYEYLATWVKKGYINEDVLTLDATGAQKMLGSGEAAFMVRGIDNIVIAREYYPEANIGILPLPSSANGAPSYRLNENDAWGVWKDTKNEEACWALLAFLARPEIVSEWCDITGALPAIKGAKVENSYAIDQYRKAFDACEGFVQSGNIFDREFFPSGMWSVMATSVAEMIDNPDDVSAAVETLRDNYLDLMAA